MADDKDKKIPEVPHLTELTGKEKIPVSAEGQPRYIEVEQVREGLLTEEEVNKKIEEELYKEGIDTNGYEFVDLGLPSGTLWATCNVGAKNETERGLYFQWGDTKGYVDACSESESDNSQDKHYFYWSKYKFGTYNNVSKYNSTDGLTTLELEDDAAHVNMGGNWRMPKITEWRELISNTNGEIVSDYKNSGISGLLLKSKNNGNSIFIPYCGVTNRDVIGLVNRYAYYWASDLYNFNRAKNVYSDSNTLSTVNADSVHDRSDGMPIRAILDPSIKSTKYPTKEEITKEFVPKSDIVQETGDSEEKVMSQKAVSDSLPKEWYGTKDEFDALGDYEARTKYYILKS